jgi:hypothetical protein
MSQTPQPTPAKGPKPANWARMLKVWTLLALGMMAATLACWAALPNLTGPECSVDVLTTPGALEAEILPPDMMAARPWKFIVVHHSATASGTLEAIEQHHRGLGFEEIGYHFMINNGVAAGTRDGGIRCTPRWVQQMAGAHARVPDHPEFNGQGIGVCLIGNFETTEPTPAQMAALETLVLALMQRYDVPLERVYGHGELKNTRCPGRLFPMEAFVMDLRSILLKQRLATQPGGA